MRHPAQAAALVLALVAPMTAHAQIRVIDQLDEREDTGIWSRAKQKGLDAAVITGVVSQGHWLTDVAAGAFVGAAYGWYATQRDGPLVLAVTGRSVFVGLRYRF